MQSDFRKQELFSFAAMNVYRPQKNNTNPPGWRHVIERAQKRYESSVRTHDKIMAEQAYQDLLNALGPDPNAPGSGGGSLDVEG